MTLTIAARTRVVLSRETVRRELHTRAYVWKRARLRANNDDPERACKLALVRQTIEHLGKEEAFFWSMNSILTSWRRISFRGCSTGVTRQVHLQF
jgi:hypothetical protein